jgi:hypothetical protein
VGTRSPGEEGRALSMSRTDQCCEHSEVQRAHSMKTAQPLEALGFRWLVSKTSLFPQQRGHWPMNNSKLPGRDEQ